jgi:hypothetical protein
LFPDELKATEHNSTKLEDSHQPAQAYLHPPKNPEFPLKEEQGQHDNLEYLCNLNPNTAVYSVNCGTHSRDPSFSRDGLRR